MHQLHYIPYLTISDLKTTYVSYTSVCRARLYSWFYFSVLTIIINDKRDFTSWIVYYDRSNQKTTQEQCKSDSFSPWQKSKWLLKLSVPSLLCTPGDVETPKPDSFYNQVRKLHSNTSKKQPEMFSEARWLQIGLITYENSLFPPECN